MPGVPLFWKGSFSSEQHPTSTLQGPAEAYVLKWALEGWGRSAKGKDIIQIEFTSTSQTKSKIFFCFGGCLLLPGKPWLVGRTFPGTDFTADLIAVAISQLGLSGYVFPPAVPWQGCSKEPVLPLHSCACTHLRICSGRPTWDCVVCQEALSGNEETPAAFLLQTICTSSSHCSLNSFSWMRRVVFTQLGSQHPLLFLSGGTGLCSGTGGWSPPVWLFPKCEV